MKSKQKQSWPKPRPVLNDEQEKIFVDAGGSDGCLWFTCHWTAEPEGHGDE